MKNTCFFPTIAGVLPIPRQDERDDNNAFFADAIMYVMLERRRSNKAARIREKELSLPPLRNDRQVQLNNIKSGSSSDLIRSMFAYR
jgi:hypothetical protein